MGFIDKNGNYLKKPEYYIAHDFSNGLAAVLTKHKTLPYFGKYGYINTNGEFVIQPQFQLATGFSEGLASVQLESQDGYINTKGEWIWKPTR